MTDCYHCASPIAPKRKVVCQIDGVRQVMCCHGCATVAQVIHESGLADYYKKRTARPRPVDEYRKTPAQALAEIFDDEIIHQEFVSQDNGSSSARFIVQHMHCPSCVWLIESRLNALAGVSRAKINYRTQQLIVTWRSKQVSLSDLVRCIQELGYGVVPYSPSTFSQTIRTEHKSLLKRLGVAGIFGMQIMVIAVALYSSAWTGIDSRFEELFRRLSLLFVLPIMLYCAAPIFFGAVRDLKAKTATMDVPIALGLLIAFVASITATFSGRGEIYYDSIAMFVFFQLIARFLEKSAYQRMTDRITALSAAAPNHANRLKTSDQHDGTEIVPSLRLKIGDHVLVKPGEAIPADGIITSGTTGVDEAILTGESNVIERKIGDAVFGGSLNLSHPVVIKVTRPSTESALASIVNLLEDSISGKPSGRRLTDLIAGRFSISVVMLATITAAFWYWSGSAQWLSHTIAVLVVACPCALALAVPTALTAAINSAAKRNILIAHPDAVHELAGANFYLFDKTGTLTQSQAQLKKVETYPDFEQSEACQVAAALSQFSQHPICRAVVRAQANTDYFAEKVKITHGGGIEGRVDGRQYFFGSFEFASPNSTTPTDNSESESPGLVAYLSNEDTTVAAFHFDNPLRQDAKSVITYLQNLPVRLALITGDRHQEAERIATALNIDEFHWNCSPSNKLEIIREHQARKARVAMIGDGINDAPTLAGANVSIAPASSQQIAKAHADVLLLDDQLDLLSTAHGLAQFAVKIMRRNTVWAIAYNLVGISLAAAGFVPPLAAAIGMSASSVLVVGNSLRILSYRQNRT